MIDLDRLLQDADDFQRLVELLMKEKGMDQATAQRTVIHSGHKRLEFILTEYIKASGENSSQYKGLLDKILKK
jgi:hemerythrin superfamily protein